MTRVNTNVSSLSAQTRLQRTNNDLQTALTRLSTGLKINSGKDDPAGLIASESLRSDITSIGKALTNTQRANQIIGTADSALGQVSSLLNDIRGLVTEAANKGGLSDDEIAVATCLQKMAEYVDGGPHFCSLAQASQDHYLGLMMEQAIATQQPVETQSQVWSQFL